MRSFVEDKQQLSQVPLNTGVIVRAMQLDPDVQELLEGMGLRINESLVVLRHASFGGPLHLRLHWATEIAIDRSIAERITVSLGPAT